MEDRLAGCLLGGAIGDAMGLPFEGIQGSLRYVPPDAWRISDDTQLTLATCEAIVEAGGVSPETIAKHFLKWFREGRIHGIGSSTLKAFRELDAGGHWALVGRKGEMAAGNGAAMRSAPLGFLLNPDHHDDRVTLRDVCRITHHNDEAYVGALAVVSAVHLLAFKHHALKPSLLDAIHRLLPDSNVKDRLRHVRGLVEHHTIQDCATQSGTSGYVAESVPLALAAVTFVNSLGFQRVEEAIIECGGDTDTTASIAGQIAGTAFGIGGLPTDLVRCIESREDMRSLAARIGAIIQTANRRGNTEDRGTL
jgi:ADP-ribosylglycohydrolase